MSITALPSNPFNVLKSYFYTMYLKINECVAAINSGLGNFTTYVALLSEAGTAAPTAVIMNNTLGVVPTLARSAAGVYTITATGKFTVGKTFVQLPVNGQDISYTVAYTSVDIITITTKVLTTGVNTDAILTDAAIEIRVYP